MKHLVQGITLFIHAQYISAQRIVYHDQTCFNNSFRHSISDKTMNRGPVIIRIFHTRHWIGKQQTTIQSFNYRLPENQKKVFKFTYQPLPGFRNENPRNLTVYYDSKNEDVKAAIGIIIIERHMQGADKEMFYGCYETATGLDYLASKIVLTNNQKSGTLEFYRRFKLNPTNETEVSDQIHLKLLTTIPGPTTTRRRQTSLSSVQTSN